MDASAYFPKWGRAYVDPASNFQSFVNPVSVTIEDIEQKEDELINQMAVTLYDPEYEPYRAWIVTSDDVLSGTSTFFSTISSVSGSIDGQEIPIVLTDNDSFQDSPPTAFFVSGSIPLSGTEVDPISCVFSDAQKKMYITYKDSLNTSTIGLPSRWGGHDDTAVSTGLDPMLVTQTIDRAVAFSGDRLLLDQTVIETLMSGETATNVLDEVAGLTTTVPLSGVISFVDTSTWTTAKYNDLIDFDHDGVIDQREVDEISRYIGYKRDDFTANDWATLYDKYDTDGNGVIDNIDLAYVLNSMNTMRIGGSLIMFNQTGRWRFNVYTTADGLAGTSSYFMNGLSVGSIRGQTYGSMTDQLPTGCIYGVYHRYMDAYILASATEHALYVVQLNSNGLLFDRVKYPIPIRAPGSSLRGITIYQDNVFVLRTDNRGSTILMMDARNAAIDHVLLECEIHSGTTVDRDVYARDGAGLSDPHGLTFIGGHKLATIDNDSIKVIMPLFDYATVSLINGTYALHFRERYSEAATNNPQTIFSTYYYLYTQLDYMAMLTGLLRLPGEDNWSLKSRTLDAWLDFPDRTQQGIVFGIARELNCDSYRTYNIEQFVKFSGDVGNFTNVNVFIDDVLTSGTVESYPLMIGNNETYSVVKSTVVSGDYEINVAVDNTSMVVNVRS
jgi:hypothetical protein